MPRARRATVRIPAVTSPSYTYELNDYSVGMDNYASNDSFVVKNGGVNKWRLAQNARITTRGEYETRKGFDVHSSSSGLTLTTMQSIGTGGAANQSFDENRWIAQKFTSAATGLLMDVDVNIRNAASTGTGTVLVELWTDDGGAPGELIDRSSIAAFDIGTSYAYLRAYFVGSPSVTNGTTYWLIGTVQPSGASGYTWSSTTAATTALVSTNSGDTWSSTSYSMNYRLHIAGAGTGVLGIHRATKSDGTKATLFASGTSLYTVDEGTGAVTTIKSGLNASATAYRFVTVNDIVYYVNGFDGYRKWDFTTESQVSVTNYRNIALHKGLIWLQRQDDPGKWEFSNFGLYETFTSTDFIYVPAPKTGDPCVTFTTLNGYALIRTINRAYMLSGDTNDTFRLDTAPDQKGTYTAETSCSDKNYEYFLSDDGVYRSNGTQPELLSESIYDAINNIGNKSKCCIAINKGRLYLWYTSAGAASNDSCYVWNLNYKSGSDTVESHDTDAFVNRALSSYNDREDMLVGSSRIGQLMWQERDSNDYTNMGGDIDFELRTHYLGGSSPAVLKQNRYWKPRFGTGDDNYTVDCEYAYDLRDNWELVLDVDIQGIGSIWGDPAMVWGSFIWGASFEVEPPEMYIPGEYRRTAVRYKHYATRQPVRFLGHTFRNQERRLR